MREITRQTEHTDEDKLDTTSAEDVPIDVLDTHTIKNKGAFARHDIEKGTFIGEYAGEVLLEATSEIQRPQSEYLFTVGGGLVVHSHGTSLTSGSPFHVAPAATCPAAHQLGVASASGAKAVLHPGPKPRRPPPQFSRFRYTLL